ncbi:MAG: hypothetical protein DMG08_22295 [Acidobacteria bacterium]|nr:MAG: hypothetical protein DMG08_22295 [Acidobacteriota bacterium]
MRDLFHLTNQTLKCGNGGVVDAEQIDVAGGADDFCLDVLPETGRQPSAITPAATPSTEMAEITETRVCLRLAFRYLKATKSSNLITDLRDQTSDLRLTTQDRSLRSEV